MKIIHLEISNCSDCPYKHWHYECEEYQCRNEQGPMQLLFYDEYSKSIPKWCPLEEHE